MKKLTLLQTALKMTERGYSIIPVDENKNPAIKSWSQYQETPMSVEEAQDIFKNAKGIALLAGGKYNITIIDLDLKNSLDPDLYEKILSKIPASIYKRCMVNKTKNNGYHWITSHENGVGNIKLAQRETTDEEVMESFQADLHYGVKAAMKMALGDKVRVLIETRSFLSTVKIDKTISKKASGYCLIPPSKGYEYIEGKIGVLNKEEFELLLSVMREFNTFVPEKYNLKASATLGNDIWEEANNKLDTVEMLTAVGWKVIREVGDEVRLLRPGVVSSTTSGVYHKSTKIFVAFSSSTIFDPGKGYMPSMVFIELEDGDINAAKAKLTEILK